MLLPSFKILKRASIHGNNIRYTINFQHCENLSTKQHFLNDIAVYTPNEVLINEQSITSSLDHFTKDNPLFPAQPVLEHIRFLFKNDGYLYLSTEILNPNDYSSMSDVFTVKCKLDKKAVAWHSILPDNNYGMK